MRAPNNTLTESVGTCTSSPRGSVVFVHNRWSRHGALLLVLVLTLGHSAGMQVIGWANMLLTRSVDRGVAAAITSTFSGEEPCQFCKLSKAIAAKEQGIADDGKQLPNPGAKTVKKPDFAHVELFVIPTPTTGISVIPAGVVLAFLAIPPPAPEPPPPRFI